MKNLKSYIGLVCACALAVSCNDILDTSPTNILTNEAVWSNKDAIDAYLGDLYNAMQVEDLEYHVGTEAQYPSQLTDEATRSYTWGNSNNQLIPEGIFGWWGYNQIRDINTFIENINSAAVLHADQRKIYEAEARFCRAMNYFAMVKRYGGVPLVTVAQQFDGQDIQTLRLPRSKEYEIYDFIKVECQAIEDILPETRTANEHYRATRYAAYALECRAMLYAASEAKYGNVQLDGLVGIPADKATCSKTRTHDCLARCFILSVRGKAALLRCEKASSNPTEPSLRPVRLTTSTRTRTSLLLAKTEHSHPPM